jgi:hypothetical protein
MHSILSLVFGAVLAVLTYGLSFFPSATLGQINEGEESISRADQEGTNSDAEDARAPSGALRDSVGRESPLENI